MLVRRWTRAWIPGLVLVLLPVACKQEPTDPFGSSRTKDPAGHPVLGVESVPLNASAFAVAINRDGVYYVTTVFGPVVRGVLPSTDLSNQLQSGILDSQVRISPDGRTAYVNNQDAGTIEVIDVRTNVITDTIHAIRSILTTGISNDGQTLYSLTDYHGIDIISTSTLQITANIPASSVGSLLTGIAFHPTQPLMYVAARDAGVVTVVQIPANTVVDTRGSRWPHSERRGFARRQAVVRDRYSAQQTDRVGSQQRERALPGSGNRLRVSEKRLRRRRDARWRAALR